MKSIDINKKQKEMLLEMCKVLFPEYVIYPADNDGFIEGEQWVGDQNMGEDRPVNEFNIHWFEFCMTHLCDKISMNLTNQMCTGMPQYYDESEKLDWNSQSLVSMLKECHPIDYLYDEFQKLK